CMQAAELWTF
nr:immunoglobulin light chain junction region [Macaca mulatta]MOW12911.1 immunoglobulin light chain junction region [Macaca mulatta]